MGVEYSIEYREHDGVKIPLVRSGDCLFSVVIPSRKRVEKTANNPLVGLSSVFVAEEEVDDYVSGLDMLDVKPGAVVPHDRHGMSPVRNRMKEVTFDQWDDVDFHLQVDDDFIGIRYVMTLRSIRHFDLDTILTITLRDAVMAMDMGAPLFFYSYSEAPYERRSYQPYRLRVWGQECYIGLLDRDLRWDENIFAKADIDLTLQAIKKSRVVLQSARHVTIHDEKVGRTGNDPGGLAGIRTVDTEWADAVYLQKKWGSEVIDLGGRERGQVKNVVVHL